MIRNRERVVSKDDLIAAIWDGRIVSDAAVTTRINVARAAIGDSGEEQRLIKTLPRKGFRFVGAVREEEAASAAVAKASTEGARTAFTLPDKPSIAVLPFANLNADPEQEYFADGIVADIITELSRFGELFVIARNSSFQYKGKAVDVRQVGRELGVRYLLEGSIRRGGDRIRISAQLIDAATGAHRWAEHYDRNLEEVFAVQDEVVRTIVAILAAHVRKAETERTRGNPPNSWQAYDYYLQAAESQASFSSSSRAEDLDEAGRLLQQSLSVDAHYARSYALLSRTRAVAWMTPSHRDFLNSAALDLAHQFARKAVQFDPNLPEGRAALGFVLAWKGQHEASLRENRKSVCAEPKLRGVVPGTRPRRCGTFAAGCRCHRGLDAARSVLLPPVPWDWPITCSNNMSERYRSSVTGHPTSSRPQLARCDLRAIGPDGRGSGRGRRSIADPARLYDNGGQRGGGVRVRGRRALLRWAAQGRPARVAVADGPGYAKLRHHTATSGVGQRRSSRPRPSRVR